MLILDTNVISELIKPTPNPSVMAWFKHLSPQPLATTSITAAELSYGAAILPDGKRKQAILEALAASMAEFKGLILPFDHVAANVYGELMAHLRQKGTPIGQSDAMIAAITARHEGQLITRNIRHFEPCGIDIINPFAFG